MTQAASHAGHGERRAVALVVEGQTVGAAQDLPAAVLASLGVDRSLEDPRPADTYVGPRFDAEADAVDGVPEEIDSAGSGLAPEEGLFRAADPDAAATDREKDRGKLHDPVGCSVR